MSRVVTLVVGLLLVVGAFLGFLFWGAVTNPPPFRVVVALKDIPPGGEISPDSITIDEQIINPRVAQRFILESELSKYLGATAVENIFAGEPLTKLRIATGDVANRTKRLSLALKDERLVAMVIPVTPKTSPQEIVPGDLINLVWGVGSQTSLNNLDGQVPALNPQAQRVPTPAPRPPDASALATQVVLPFARTVLYRAVVARVNFQQVPNPNYAIGGMGATTTVQPFLQGPIESLVLLVPRETQEMVAFALSNGTVSITLWSSQVAPGDVTPLPGVMWSDVLAGMLANRATTGRPTLDNLDYLMSLPSGITNTMVISPTLPLTTTMQPTRTLPLASPTRKP